jgi:mono/diheme cytochrome c family protein
VIRSFVIVSVLVVGLGAALAFAQATDWEVPAEAKAQKNPVAPTEADIKAGQALYEKHCLMCHGEKAHGDGSATKFIKPAPPDISTVAAKERLTDGEIFYKISTGKRPMPPTNRKLSETERWQVVLYLRTLQIN